ncbi:signal transduction histidine kinase [Mucilaginibacter yixingensis]|uniref:histidine kinase n=1 Tax=Mucilaginibacter yixingensis TaxID=1295612 RepID=A0A2T5JAT4_9SPHI|nr:HAMP domain-containing sensor histidine kinase [Mucilaginibacter yixingensis]PTQ97980.1 signal transduction histidine kinase [Mucilaginibacter yixingensis]
MTACIFVFGCLSVFAAASTERLDTVAGKNEVDRIVNLSIKETLTRPDSSRALAGRSLILAKKLNYDLGIGRSFFQIGMTYWAQSVVPVSQFYMMLAAPYLKNDKAWLATCYRCMGRNYVDLRQYPQAMQYFKKGLKLVGNSPEGKAEMYTEITVLYSTSRQYDVCLRYVDTALTYSRRVHNDDFISILYSRLGQVYLEKNKLEIADKWLDSCLTMSVRLKNTRLHAITLMDKSRLFLMRKQYQKAVDYANKGYQVADELGSTRLKIRAVGLLASVSEQQGNTAKAYALQKQVLSMRKEMDREGGQKAIQLVIDYSILNRKLNDIESLSRTNEANQARIKSQHRIIALLVVLLVTALITLLITYLYYRQKQNLNNKLKTQHQRLSDQKQLIEAQRADLEEVNRVKNKLLAIIGHDLRTPIANLNSITSLFADGHITTDELNRLMVDIIPIVRGAELTLANLTDFAQSQIKGKKVHASRVDVCQISNETEEIFRHQLKRKGIIFINECVSGCFATADANHVKVVMRNLIGNAIKFTEYKGRVKVTCQENKEMLEICVEDNGIGMSAEHASKVFNNSEHISKVGTMGESGTGLGLMLCRELIALNGGELWVETHEKEGCRFSFSLPLATQPIA